MPAEENRTDLETLWAAIFGLYSARPAIGTLGAELLGLALEAEDLIALDPTRARVHKKGRAVAARPRRAGGQEIAGSPVSTPPSPVVTDYLARIERGDLLPRRKNAGCRGHGAGAAPVRGAP